MQSNPNEYLTKSSSDDYSFEILGPTNILILNRFLTTPLSVEPNPHGNMAIPRDRMESDEFCV